MCPPITMTKTIKKYYMHTINHQPAFFSRGQICHCANIQGARTHNILVKTSKQIREEQRKSNLYRKANCLTDDDKLDYIIVYTPEGSKG